MVKLLEGLVDDGRRSTAHHVLAHLRKMFNWAIARDAYGLSILAGRPRHGAGHHRRREAAPAGLERSGDPGGLAGHVRREAVRPVRRIRAAVARHLPARCARSPTPNGRRPTSRSRLWTIPAARMKGAASHEIPLSGLAIEIIEVGPAGEREARHVCFHDDGVLEADQRLLESQGRARPGHQRRPRQPRFPDSSFMTCAER